MHLCCVLAALTVTLQCFFRQTVLVLDLLLRCVTMFSFGSPSFFKKKSFSYVIFSCTY